jgi:hypothetical protein
MSRERIAVDNLTDPSRLVALASNPAVMLDFRSRAIARACQGSTLQRSNHIQRTAPSDLGKHRRRQRDERQRPAASSIRTYRSPDPINNRATNSACPSVVDSPLYRNWHAGEKLTCAKVRRRVVFAPCLPQLTAKP